MLRVNYYLISRVLNLFSHIHSIVSRCLLNPKLGFYFVYQNPEKYYGDRSKASLTQFAMQFVTARVTELWQGYPYIPSFIYLCPCVTSLLTSDLCVYFFKGNVFTEIDQAFASKVGWLITFCAQTGGKFSATL